MSDGITAAGGWWPPASKIYGETDAPRIELPEFSISRGGINFTQFEPTEQQKAIQEHVARLVGNIRKAQDAALDAACITALVNGWDLYVDRSANHGRATRFIGIGFVPGRHAVPTIHETGYNEWGTSFDWDALYEEES